MGRFIKVTIFCLCTIIVAGLILATAAPTILSSSWGQEQIAKILSSKVRKGSVNFSNVELSWFGPQKIDHFAFLDQQGNPILEIDSLEMNASLFDLLRKNLRNGNNLIVKGVNASIIPNPATSQTNIEEALGLVLFPKSITNPKPIYFNDMHASINSTPTHEVLLKAEGRTLYGDLSGSFNIDLKKSDKNTHWTADVINFPVAILDAIAEIKDPSMRGLFVSLFGESMNVRTNQTMVNDGINFKINADSPIFSAMIDGQYAADNIVLASPANVRLTLTPELIRALYRSQEKQWSLAEPTELRLTIKKLQIPAAFLSEGIKDNVAQTLSFESDLKIASFELMNLKHQDLNAKIKEFALAVNSPENGNRFNVSFSGGIAMARDNVGFNATSSFPKPLHARDITTSLTAPADVQVKVQDFPTILFDVLLGSESMLADLIGKEVTFQLTSHKYNLNDLHLSLKSQFLSASDISLKFDQNLPLDLNDAGKEITGEIVANRLELIGAAEPLVITNFQAPWKVKNNFTAAEAIISCQTQLHAKHQKGSFNGKIDINKKNQSNISFDLQGERLPSPILEWLSKKPELSSLFGDAFQVRLNGNVGGTKGKILADISGDRGSISLKSRISDGFLYLDEPFKASFQPSAEVARKVLGRVIPIFNEFCMHSIH